MHKSTHRGIIFIEGIPDDAQHVEPVSCEINGFITQAQLKSIDDVKDILCSMARAKNCNAVIDFNYGQRSTFWKSLIGMDDVHWYATGILARITTNPVA